MNILRTLVPIEESVKKSNSVKNQTSYKSIGPSQLILAHSAFHYSEKKYSRVWLVALISCLNVCDSCFNI